MSHPPRRPGHHRTGRRTSSPNSRGVSMSSGTDWEEEYGYSDAVLSGHLLFCSGQVSLDSDGTPPADPERQYDLAFATLGALLAKHGASPLDLVELTSFHVD